MPPTASGDFSFTVALVDEQATRALVADVAAAIESGDLITLSGDLGVGKTTFARALIRHLAADQSIDVPSPTFTLTQSYALPQFTLMHADLYRLSDAAELDELGIDGDSDATVTLVEWPERAAGALPADRLDIALALSPQQGENFRSACITGHGRFAAKAERIRTIRDFLQANGFGSAERARVTGDASSRSYERLTLRGETYILMNSPKRPDGPVVRDGKSYSAIAHLAEDVTPFIALSLGLRKRGFSAPAIFAADRAAGLLLIEDLGDDRLVSDQPPAPIEERYAAAADLLAGLHRERPPPVLPVARGVEYALPSYDMEALLIEAELLLDWFLPKLGAKISDARRDLYLSHWRDALLPIVEAPAAWVLRDVHSPNLLWLSERSGIARVGLLDFQDAVLGHAAYDVASLLQDARVDVPEAMEIALLTRYTRARLAAEPDFDVAGFAQAYATLAAQRASKILGIFARLERCDRKPQYLRHIPRVWTYLQRSLAHPALAALQSWYRANLPSLKTH